MGNPEPKSYKRLPGTGYRRTIPGWAMVLLFFVIGIFVLLFRGRRLQLWLGEDHLLAVEWDGNKEYYKRYYFNDIQSLMIRKTPEATVINAVLGCIAGFFGILAVATDDPGGRIALLVIGGLFFLFLVANLIAGPTCMCLLRTAVQSDELPSLKRVRIARKAFGQIRSRILAAQGEVPAAEIPARLVELVTRARGPATPASPQGIPDARGLPPRLAG